MSDSEPIWVDITALFERLDALGRAVSTASAPTIATPGTVGHGGGDAALIDVTSLAGRALQSLNTQITILRDEMRVTALSAEAADEAYYMLAEPET